MRSNLANHEEGVTHLWGPEEAQQVSFPFLGIGQNGELKQRNKAHGRQMGHCRH